MSDAWQVPEDLADSVRKVDYTDAWRVEIERTARVRDILTDLIAELRGRHPAGDYCCCGWCTRDKEAAYRAEARLRDLD